MNSSRFGYDRFSGCTFAAKPSDSDDGARIQRLAGIDFASGKYSPKKHGFDSTQQACYRIEFKRLKGIKTFSFQ